MLPGQSPPGDSDNMKGGSDLGNGKLQAHEWDEALDAKMERLFKEQQEYFEKLAKEITNDLLAHHSRLCADQDRKIIEAVVDALSKSRQSTPPPRATPSTWGQKSGSTRSTVCKLPTATSSASSKLNGPSRSQTKIGDETTTSMDGDENGNEANQDEEYSTSQSERVSRLWDHTAGSKMIANQMASAESIKQAGDSRTSLRPQTKIGKIVKSAVFDYFIVCLIILNAVFVGIETDWRVTSSHGQEEPQHFRAIDMCFVSLFTVELALRIWVERCKFFHGHYWKWNLLDVVIVAAALVELAMSSLMSSITVVRLMRMLRLARVMRGARMLRYFKDLRLMVNGIVSCAKSLFWCIFLLVFVMFVVTVIFLDVLNDNIIDGRSCGNEEDCRNAFLAKHFGSVWKSILSLFKAITGGHDWGEYAEVMGSVHGILTFIFCFYIAFAVFTVLNIVTGVFVENAAAFAQRDHENIVMEDLGNRHQLMKDMRSMFRQADVDKSGRLDWQEFTEHFENPTVQAYLRNLEIGVEAGSARALFDILDFEGNGEIDIDSFVIGLTHLRGSAKSLDIAKLRHDHKKMQLRLKELSNLMSSGLEALGYHVEQLGRTSSAIWTDQDQAFDSCDSCDPGNWSRDSGKETRNAVHHPALQPVAELS